MRNSKGFSLIESLVAASLLMMIITTLIPATNLLLNERESLKQKRIMTNELHSELQPFIWEEENNLPQRWFKMVNGSEAEFRFTSEDNLLKGCVIWNNAKNKTDQFCLYGNPDK
ncbi:hypothetical protein SAMN04488072_101174 [Lentibacillus halodurans]|uniref:Prepilin-type N-terminal cleavage/methylation domain-containing protein n=1 Tax=Lentibacillus halodurans TaxID=237679 RepID=A0A1I0V559_9BACI|nr:prepilin-type N-terminal cleavage/methylation domain-containing protein [Lentibacillus halodurans]SFA71187.1 hypothetical protein SAMN04488072_101174 [Lentibacillus halodurans]